MTGSLRERTHSIETEVTNSEENSDVPNLREIC